MNMVSPASIYVALFLGTPQWFIITWGLHLYTDTKIQVKKYIILSLLASTITFLVRLLPISLGVNTIMALMIEIVMFQIFYNKELSKIFRLIISAMVFGIFTAVAEVFNMMLLVQLFGQDRAIELYKASGGLVQTLSATPSNIFLAIFVYGGYLALKAIRKRKGNLIGHGETGKETGE